MFFITFIQPIQKQIRVNDAMDIKPNNDIYNVLRGIQLIKWSG